ncbi:unnamed protein product [Heterosigma akashiwo]
MMMGKVCFCAILVLFAFFEVCHAFNAAPHHQGGIQCLRKVSTTLFSTAAESSLALSGDGDDLANFQFPEPLTPGQRAQRSVQFYSKIAPLLLRYATFEKGLQGMSELEKEAKWDELHEWGSEILSNTIKDLKGFYVKTGQVISTRVDLFPMQYTTKLMMLQDSVDPVDAQQIKAIVRQELLEGEPLSTLFRSFEDAPLGSASIAQVHKAVLNDGRTVAVKVQRPSEEPKLRGDIKNLKTFAKLFADQLPVDYYTVFCELERALTNELDFRAEAQAMEKIAATVAYKVDGTRGRRRAFVPRRSRAVHGPRAGDGVRGGRLAQPAGRGDGEGGHPGRRGRGEGAGHQAADCADGGLWAHVLRPGLHPRRPPPGEHLRAEERERGPDRLRAGEAAAVLHAAEAGRGDQHDQPVQ